MNVLGVLADRLDELLRIDARHGRSIRARSRRQLATTPIAVSDGW
jgi:hypothetical protein